MATWASSVADVLVVGHVVERRRCDAPDLNGVEPHLGGELAGQVPREEREGRFGGAVGREARLDHAPGAGRDVDDGSTALLGEVGHTEPRQQECRRDVEVEGVLEAALGRPHGLARQPAAGVVDEDVDAAELGGRRIHQAFELLALRDVRGPRNRSAAELARLESSLLERG